MSSSQISSSSSEPALIAPGLLDVVCRVDVVLGTGRITVADCLKLRRQSVIRLAESAGSDLEVRVHGVTAAEGEVVIVDDSTAIRVTAICRPAGEEPAR